MDNLIQITVFLKRQSRGYKYLYRIVIYSGITA